MTAEDPTRWRTVAETAEHFNIGRNKVYENCKSGQWPCHRAGTHANSAIRFSPEDWQEIADLMRPASAVAARVVRGPSRSKRQRGLQRLAAAA